jgi:hypothetical protein
MVLVTSLKAPPILNPVYLAWDLRLGTSYPGYPPQGQYVLPVQHPPGNHHSSRRQFTTRAQHQAGGLTDGYGLTVISLDELQSLRS